MNKPRSTPKNALKPAMNDASRIDPSSPKDHYAREKARRATVAPADDEAMAAARREYQAMLEMNAAKGRGGRPKKQPAPQKSEGAPDAGDFREE
jgi:hypothetical protein